MSEEFWNDVDSDFSISPSHKMITCTIDVKKPEKTKKTLTFRNKRNLNTNELLTNIIDEVSVESCNACPHASECKRKCLCCMVKLYNSVMKKKYDDMCPVVMKEANNGLMQRLRVQ